MSFFFDIFNPSFFIFLGLLMLFLACLILYFESKWREQNHKISSMVSLVSSLAEEVNHTKLVLSTVSMQQQHQRDSIRHSVYTNNDSNTKDELIAVSDEEDANDDDANDDDADDADDDGEDDIDDDEDGEDEEDREDIGGGLREIKSILFDKPIHHANMKLNEIDLNDDEEDKDKDESMIFSQGTQISLNQIMASILQNAHMVPFRLQQDLEEEPVELEENEVEELDESEIQLEELEPFVQNHEEADQHVDKSVEIKDIKSIDLSSINISNELSEQIEKPVKKVKKVNKEIKEEEKEEIDETDFKKMSIQRLRTVVLEKQLSPDPSKMKKQELLKLLTV